MKCLDQGIDVPEARIGIFLSSTKNSQQFVQRRGRVLRKAPGKFNAEIYDMIVRPPKPEPGEELTLSEKNLLRYELSRAAELAHAADNQGEILFLLNGYAREYRLDDTEPIPWLDGNKPEMDLTDGQNNEIVNSGEEND